jgi:predicted HTH transcriptional regulator
MYGSFANHAWLESALHVEPFIEPETTHIDTVTVEREFKAAPGTRSQKLKFHIDTLNEFSYSVESLGNSLNATAQRVLEIINGSETPVTTGELMTVTGFSRTTISEEVNKLVRMGKVNANRGGGRGNPSSYIPKAPS